MCWQSVRLGDLCRIEKGTTGINKAIPGEYPMVVTSEERKSHNEYQFDDAAVIIPLVSSTGHGHKSLKRIHFQQDKFALGSILCAVIPKDRTILNAEYLYRYLDLNKVNELVARMKGMANVTLPIKEIAQIPIPVPPIHEQIEFVKRYKHLENKSESIDYELTHQLSLLKQLRQQILQDAVQGKLVPQDPNDEPASVLLKRIKAEKEQLIREKKIKPEKPLPAIKAEEVPFEIPESWVWCRLGEVGNSTVSSIVDGPFGSSINVNYDYIETGIPVIRMINVKPFQFLANNLKFIRNERYQQLLRHNIIPGDVLLAKVGAGIGESCIFPDIFPEGLLSTTGLARFRVGSIMDPEYLTIYLNCFENDLKGLSQNTSQPFLNMTDIKRFHITLPPKSEQSRIVVKVDQLMALCDELEQSIKQNQEYTRQLLQVALKEALKNNDI